ncbi:hypothetical protein BaRGS_00036056 [Batillaria attramentaria]|uniref:Ankyrin repeat and SOCS box protein 17 n=1 Tax=Batillaria attramentaria TaxID=370345 RepID=A0ABD0JD38_9CAEN
MRTYLRDYGDNMCVNDFLGWANLMHSMLDANKRLPETARNKLASFVHRLCTIHRNEMLAVASGGGKGCLENHHYLYNALRLCFDFHLNIPVKVSMLIREIFLCEGSLEAIFSILQPSRHAHRNARADVNIDSYTLYTGPRRLYRQAFEYYVKNISLLNKDPREDERNPYKVAHILNTPIDGVSGNTPLLAAVTSCHPIIVLFLLRHGADPLHYQKGDEDKKRTKSAVEYVVDKLNMSAMLSEWAGPQPGTETNGMNREERMKLCLIYFAQAVYALDIRVASKNVDTNSSEEEKFANGLFFEVNAKIADMLEVQTTYRCPPSLRHASRCVIRRALMDAGKEDVSTAVMKLPVPQIMQSYLDLRVKIK